MSHEVDISFLDKPEILRKIFPLAMAYSFTGLPQADSMNADAYFIDVDEGVRICCKFYVEDNDCPSLLYFHGNSETALNQSSLASNCLERGINLFVTDYRGYGISDGEPTMTNLFHDCHRIYDSFKKIIREGKYKPSVYVMGHSLGSIPAIELSYHYQREFKGLIIASGSAQNLNSLWSSADAAAIQKLAGTKFYNKDKIKEITIPTLVIHGEQDNLIPVQVGKALYEISGAKDKNLVIIPDASHHDLIDSGECISAIEKFVKKKPRSRRARTGR
jgi:alpha-beta hydrolase superfamily lysophospholipase